VLKVSFDERDNLFDVRLDWRTLPARLGWRSRSARIAVPLIADATSYHFEFEAPDGIEVESASLVAVRGGRVTRTNRVTESTSRAHLYVSGVTPGARGQALVQVRAVRNGLIRMAWAFSLFAFVLLFVAANWIERVQALESSADAAAAILLAVPGVVAAYIAKPGEHLMASQMLIGVRALALLSGLALYVEAVAIVVGLKGDALTVTTVVLTGLAFAVLRFADPQLHSKRKKGLM
jgi:hypothetical protein